MSEKVFHDIIYKVNGAFWQDHTCGTGSLLKNTVNVRQQLPKIIKEFSIKSMLDAPCGDFSWMSTLDINTIVDYTGGDIVSKMVAENKSNNPNYNFIHIDVVNSDLPDVDLLFTRDLLIHLSNDDILKLIKNIANSNVKYWLVSNYTNTVNSDVSTGHHRPVNLKSNPFNFPKPLLIFDDSAGHVERHMALWEVDSFR